MAAENSKPGKRSGKGRFPERRLKVEAGFYYYPPSKEAPHGFGRLRPVPQLRLKGVWLERAGFLLDTPVRIIVSPGRLVVEVRTHTG